MNPRDRFERELEEHANRFAADKSSNEGHGRTFDGWLVWIFLILLVYVLLHLFS